MRRQRDTQQLVDGLAQVSFRMMAILSRIGAEHDLSLTQLRTLGILRDRRARIGALADYLGLEKSTLSGLIDRAERRGLVARGTSPGDGRVVEVYLSPEGVALAAKITAEVEAAIDPLLSGLASRERAELTDLLDRLLEPSRSPEP